MAEHDQDSAELRDASQGSTYRVTLIQDVTLPKRGTPEYGRIRHAYLAGNGVPEDEVPEDDELDMDIAGWLAGGTDHDFEDLVEVIDADIEEL